MPLVTFFLKLFIGWDLVAMDLDSTKSTAIRYNRAVEHPYGVSEHLSSRHQVAQQAEQRMAS